LSERGTSYEGQRPPSGHRSGERRVALVIGNSAYAHAEALRNPVNDAKAMAGVLTRLGFDLVKGIDVDLRGIGDLQAVFEDKLRGQPDVALLFYAGHGLQVAGRNYLVPVDAEITQRAHLASRALLFNDLLDDMAAQAQASLIFLDACRDNPFTRNLARAMGDTARYAGVRGGLARIEKVAGTFIAYATAPDTVAYDGTGQNSPFTGALLEHIETPGLSVGDLMIDVRNKVLAETNERQEPWDQSTLRARFYFVPEVEDTPPPQAPEVSGAAQEWAAIQNTDSLAVLAAFQERYPDPPWSTYAEARAEELRAADEARRAEEERAREEAERKDREQEERERQEAEAWARRDEEAKRPKPSPQASKVSGVAQERAAIDRNFEYRRWAGWASTVALVILVTISVWMNYQPDPKPGQGNGTSTTEPTGTGTGAAAAVEVELASGETKRIVPGSGQSFKDCAECPEMVVAPAGRLMMGSTEEEIAALTEAHGDYFKDEGPRHEVAIPQPFAVGKFEVTWDEWEACVAAGDCDGEGVGQAGGDNDWGKGNRPVIEVSWDDAQAYAKWLSEKTGKSYRLLSEAEWEYAARAGTTGPFSFEGPITPDKANYDGNYSYAGSPKGEYRERTVPVDSFQPNPWGLYQVHGNVWEWVEDCWNNSYAEKPARLKASGEAWTTGDCNRRVLRGGSWSNNPLSLRSASRYRGLRVLRDGFNGFRLARTLTP